MISLRGDQGLFQGLIALQEGDTERGEELLRSALVFSSPRGKMEARYRLALHYHEQLLLALSERKEAPRDLVGTLTVLGYGERSQPDLRLRLVYARTMALGSSWPLVREAVRLPRQGAEGEGEDHLLQTLDLLGGIARFCAASPEERAGEADSLSLLIQHLEDEHPRELLRDMVRHNGDFRSRVEEFPLLRNLVELAVEVDIAYPHTFRELLETLLRNDRVDPSSPLILQGIRRAAYGSWADRYLQILEAGGPGPDGNGSAAVGEATAFLYRRKGEWARAFTLYDVLLQDARRAGEDDLRIQYLAWYRYDSLLRQAPRRALEEIDTLLPDMADPEYFDDVVGDLIGILLTREDWQALLHLAEESASGLSPDSAARLYYLAARLGETGHLKGFDTEEGELFYRRILGLPPSGAAVRYYKILAAEKVGALPEPWWRLFYPGVEVMPGGGSIIFQPFTASALGDPSRESEGGSEGVTGGVTEGEDLLLSGFLRHGLTNLALQRYRLLISRGAVPGREALKQLLQQLLDRGEHMEALRIGEACFTAHGISGPRDLELLYPRPWEELFRIEAEKYDLQEELLYALVREESHFDAAVSSHAGAVGLSQLMHATAVDVASRMGLPRPAISDLRDPALNLSIGAWYLDHLMGRTDTLAEALYAYNGGLTRVRRWREEHSLLPDDLFQEMIPFPETLHYGRKILVSYTIYRYLYSSEPVIRIALFWPRDRSGPGASP